MNGPNGGLLNTVARFIQTVGFPIAVAAYMLYRLDTLLREVSQAIRVNTQTLERLAVQISRELGPF